MQLIDIAGLTQAPVDPVVYADALGLSGYIVPPERREAVLRALVQRNEAHTVYTGPRGLDFWLMAPPTVDVIVRPDGVELPARARLPLVPWLMVQAGTPRGEATAAARQPPKTERARAWKPYQAALKEAQVWESGVADSLTGLPTLGIEVSGSVQTDYVLPPTPYEYKVAADPLTLVELGRALARAREDGTKVGIDTEGTSVDSSTAALVGFAISFGEVCYYCPADACDGLALDVLKKHVEKLRYVAHNAKYDYKMLTRHGVPMRLAVLAGDGMIAAYVLAYVNPHTGIPETKALKPLIQRFFSWQHPDFQTVLDQHKANTIYEVPVDAQAYYCGGDAYFGVRIEEELVHEMSPRLREIYEQVELPTVVILAEMELEGVCIDFPEAAKLQKLKASEVEGYKAALSIGAKDAGWSKTLQRGCKLHTRARAEIEACDQCDEKGKVMVEQPFNPDSPVDVPAVLHTQMGLPVLKVTEKKRLPSDDSDVLLALRRQTEGSEKDFINDLLLFRKESKEKSTYLDAWVDTAEALADGSFRIHTNLNQTVVESGRFSSSKVNLQNVPPRIRHLIIPPPGFLIWGFDYSQLELRIMAYASGCKALIEAFQAGLDAHATTAWRVFGIPEDQVSEHPDIRRRSKALNFGVGYGGGPDMVQTALTRAALLEPDLEIEVPNLQECRHMVAEYFRAYPEIADWKDRVIDSTKQYGYSRTLYGRRRYLPFINHPNGELRTRAERQAVNHVIQGTAGDFVKVAGISIANEMRRYQASLVLQVHDELWGYISKKADVNGWLERVGQLAVLDQPFTPVPVKADVKAVESWAILK